MNITTCDVWIPSLDEYKQYKDVMPDLHVWWWTSTPYDKNRMHIVRGNEPIDYAYKTNIVGGIIPFMRSNDICGAIGSEFSFAGKDWRVIGPCLAISKNPFGYGSYEPKRIIRRVKRDINDHLIAGAMPF